MKILIVLILAMLVSSSLLITNVSASTQSGSTYPQDDSNSIVLREDLPSYVFEYDLERLYPSTWEFYKKLDLINRDKVYSHYLYHPKIKDVRHQVFKLALGSNKGKTPPTPASIEQVLVNNNKSESEKLALSGTSLSSGIHRITNGPTISAINFDTNSHQTVYSFLQNN